MNLLKLTIIQVRTIKYRVYIKHWDNSENDSMEYPKEGQLHVYIGNWERGGYKEAIFQQFTGLLDKNKKEIYEGDLLEFAYLEDGKKFIGEVQYFEKFGSFGVVVDKAFETFQDLIEYAQFFNVVGNIFDNMLGAKLRLDKRLSDREKPNLDEVEFGTPHLKED